MTEEEWLLCEHPEYMTPTLRGVVSDRKLRLLSVAFCNKILHLMQDEESRVAVEVAEQFADGFATEEERLNTGFAALDVKNAAFDRWEADHGQEDPPAGLNYWAASAAAAALFEDGFDALTGALHAAGMGYEWDADESLIAGPGNYAGIELTGSWPHLIRDVVGNPFKTFKVDQQWRTSQMVELAAKIYDDKAFDKLPELGDAVAEGGCTDEDILNHCRQSNEHVRGCWVVDLILGRE